MDRSVTIEPGEYSTTEILERLKRGQRVLVRTTVAGSSHEIALRFDGQTYYCDTPTRLHRHETEDEMRVCLEREGYSAVGGDA